MLHRYLPSSLVLTVGVLIFSLGGVAHAALVLLPPELNPGDQYRLVFVTSTTTGATSSEIADYNAFVQAAADASPLSALGQTWNAIGSTDSVDARDNTHTNPLVDGVGVLIYLVDGTKVADDYDDLWSGNIDNPINVTETGEAQLEVPVWTGTDPSGLANTGGAFLGSGDAVVRGLVGQKDSDWIEYDTSFRDTRLSPMYAISDVITVVPEPAALVLCLGGFAGIGIKARKKAFARG